MLVDIFRLLYDAVMQELNQLHPSRNHAFSLRHLPNLIALYQEELNAFVGVCLQSICTQNKVVILCYNTQSVWVLHHKTQSLLKATGALCIQHAHHSSGHIYWVPVAANESESPRPLG